MTNIGQSPNAFIGRARDLEGLAELFLSGEHVVTLTGLPGIGKTRLAVEFAARWRGPWSQAGGQWFCDLTEVRDAEGVCAAVAQALRVPPDGGDPVRALGRALAAKQSILLVLDNLEQVVAPAADIIARWRTIAPMARFLLTSRERLRVEDECVLELEPLGVGAAESGQKHGDAVQLLIDRAKRVRGVKPLGDVRVLEQIAVRLEGMPLAIELAAARMGTLHPETVLERLADCFGLLTHGTRDAVRRQATLRSSIEWSWNLLQPHEQSALAQCSVFRGGFGLQAAEAVVDLSAHPEAPRILDVLQALHEKSMIRRLEPEPGGDRDRFSVYVIIREFSSERLEFAEGMRAAVDRHAKFFVEAAEAWCRVPASNLSFDSLTRLTLEHENLLAIIESQTSVVEPTREALELALRALISLDLIAHGPVGLRLAPQLLDPLIRAARAVSLSPELVARALIARAERYRRAASFAEAQRDFQDAVAIAREIKDSRLECKIHRSLALMWLNWGHHAEARQSADEALAIATREHLFVEEAYAHYALAGVDIEEKKAFASAHVHLERALDICTRERELRLKARVLLGLAQTCVEEGKRAEGRLHSEEALQLLRGLDDPLTLAQGLLASGVAEHVDEQHELALKHYEEALQVSRESGYRVNEVLVLGYIGLWYAETARFETAWKYLDESIARATESSIARRAVLFLGFRAAVEAALDRVEEAQMSLAAANAQPVSARDQSKQLIQFHQLHLDAATARHAEDAGDHEKAATLRAETRARADAILSERSEPDADALRPQSPVVLFAVRLLYKALESGDSQLQIGPNANWFQRPAGARVSLDTRRPLASLLLTLAARRIESPGSKVSPKALVEAGWPGERINPAAAKNRLAVALSTLRGLGLRGILLGDGGGYRLDPNVPIRVHPADDADSRRTA